MIIETVILWKSKLGRLEEHLQATRKNISLKTETQVKTREKTKVK